MIRRFTGALAATLGLLAGLWLMLAPVALGTQPKGLDSDWNDPTTTEFVTGAVIAFVGLVGLVAFALAIREELVRRGAVTNARAVRAGAGEGAAATTEPEPAEAAGAVTTTAAEPPRAAQAAGASEDERLAHLLAPLVEALAEDTRPGARNGAPRGGEYR